MDKGYISDLLVHRTVVKVRKTQPDAKIPAKATEGSACWDVYSCQDTLVQGGGATQIGIGLSFEIPGGWFVEIRPRSGLSSEGVIMLNSPATVDSDYRGEVRVLLTSLAGGYRIRKGDRIAQIRLVKEEEVDWEEVQELSSTDRGSGGFGSTGR